MYRDRKSERRGRTKTAPRIVFGICGAMMGMRFWVWRAEGEERWTREASGRQKWRPFSGIMEISARCRSAFAGWA